MTARYPVYACQSGRHGQHRSFRASAHCAAIAERERFERSGHPADCLDCQLGGSPGHGYVNRHRQGQSSARSAACGAWRNLANTDNCHDHCVGRVNLPPPDDLCNCPCHAPDVPDNG